ncbi:hypothetical protein AX14_012215, partial [Amanita brunnescens Koide BX004]
PPSDPDGPNGSGPKPRSKPAKPASSVRRAESAPTRPVTASTNAVAGPSRLPYTFADEPTPTQVVPAKRLSSTRQDSNQSGDSAARTCLCGLPANRLTVTSETSPNKGRVFWKCPETEASKQCKFWEWDDEPPRDPNPFRGSSAATGECYQCHQIGHWASACPNNPGGNNKRARTFGSAINDRSSTITCFTCNQEGHFSKDCPSVKNTYKSSNPSSSTFVPTCYKCGQPGHFSNACTGEAQRNPSSGARGARGARRGRGSTKSGGRRGRPPKSKITHADLYVSE